MSHPMLAITNNDRLEYLDIMQSTAGPYVMPNDWSLPL